MIAYYGRGKRSPMFFENMACSLGVALATALMSHTGS